MTLSELSSLAAGNTYYFCFFLFDIQLNFLFFFFFLMYEAITKSLFVLGVVVFLSIIVIIVFSPLQEVQQVPNYYF